ncbi:MAG TPA: serine protease [Thermoleophilaceae bacterium]
MIRRPLLVLALATAALAAAATPSYAVVGGNDAEPGEYPAVAQVSYLAWNCTGTLISPDTVLTAGHCSSIDLGTVGTPVTWPAQSIQVRVGSYRDGDGESVPVRSVVGHLNYLATKGYDISILKLARNSTKPPVRVAGAGERSIWSAGSIASVAGWGVLEDGGTAGPDTLQEADVPILTDEYCGSAYSDFDPKTMVCAGYAEGGIDTCQGDSGGPLFGHAGDGLRVVGSTSFGDGCARPGKPGVYARVADTTLREWIRGQDPDGVN